MAHFGNNNSKGQGGKASLKASEPRPQRLAHAGGRPPAAGLTGLTGRSSKAQSMGRVSLAGSSSALLFHPKGALCIPNSRGKAGRAPRSLLLGARQPRRLLLRARLAADAGCGTVMIYSCFAEARAAQAAGDIPSNTSAGEIKQSAHRGRTSQEAALNTPSTFPGATVIT